MSMIVAPGRFGAAPSVPSFVGLKYAASAAGGVEYPYDLQTGDIVIFAQIASSVGGQIDSNLVGLGHGWSGGIGNGGMGNGNRSYTTTKRIIGASVPANGDLVSGLTSSAHTVVVAYRGATNAVYNNSAVVAPLDPDTGFPISTVTQLQKTITKVSGSKLGVGLLLHGVTLSGVSTPWPSRSSNSRYNLFDEPGSEYSSGDVLTASWSSPATYEAVLLAWELT